MTRHVLPVGIPCAVCLATVTAWLAVPGDRTRAEPCRHTLEEIGDVWLESLGKRMPEPEPS